MYRSVFTSTNIKPYMHLLTDHVPGLIRTHGSLHAFNTQGLEKKNHVITVDFFKSTNHHRGPEGIDSLSQLMKKYNRKSYLLNTKSSFKNACENVVSAMKLVMTSGSVQRNECYIKLSKCSIVLSSFNIMSSHLILMPGVILLNCFKFGYSSHFTMFTLFMLKSRSVQSIMCKNRMESKKSL